MLAIEPTATFTEATMVSLGDQAYQYQYQETRIRQAVSRQPIDSPPADEPIDDDMKDNGQPRYPRVPLSAAEHQEYAALVGKAERDAFILARPMTEYGMKREDAAKSASLVYRDKLRAEVTSLLKFLQGHISPAELPIFKAHPLYAVYSLVPFAEKGIALLRAMIEHFCSATGTSALTAMKDFVNSRQGTDSYPAYLASVGKAFDKLQVLYDKDGRISGDALYNVVFLSGLNRAAFTSCLVDIMAKPNALHTSRDSIVATVSAYHKSSAALDDSPADPGAFSAAAVLPPPTPAPAKPDCPHCLRVLGRHHNKHTAAQCSNNPANADKSRNKRGGKAQQPPRPPAAFAASAADLDPSALQAYYQQLGDHLGASF